MKYKSAGRIGSFIHSAEAAEYGTKGGRTSGEQSGGRRTGEPMGVAHFEYGLTVPPS